MNIQYEYLDLIVIYLSFQMVLMMGSLVHAWGKVFQQLVSLTKMSNRTDIQASSRTEGRCQTISWWRSTTTSLLRKPVITVNCITSGQTLVFSVVVNGNVLCAMCLYVVLKTLTETVTCYSMKSLFLEREMSRHRICIYNKHLN